MPYYPPASSGGAHPDLATHDGLGLATDADLADHAGAADPHAVYQRESEKGAADGYASLDSGLLVPVAQLPVGTGAAEVAAGDHTHVGGSGATYVKKTIDQAFTTVALASDLALTFTPAASTDYAITLFVIWQSVLTTVGARFGVLLPTAGVNVAWFRGSQQVTTSGTASTDMFTEAMLAASDDDIVTATAAPQNLTNLLTVFEGVLSMTALAAGPFALRVGTETAGNAITVKPKSYLKYQAI